MLFNITGTRYRMVFSLGFFVLDVIILFIFTRNKKYVRTYLETNNIEVKS